MNSRAYVAGFNFKGSDQQRKVGVLSGGERNRVHLAKLLRRGGNVLLLDEPTNDLDVDTLRALEEALLAFPGCAVIISHDRWFLDRVATHVLAFEGDSQVDWFEGNFEAYEEHRHERLGAEADRPHRITYKKLDARVSVSGAAPVLIRHFTDPGCPCAFSAERQRLRLLLALRRPDRAGELHMVVLSEEPPRGLHAGAALGAAPRALHRSCVRDADRLARAAAVAPSLHACRAVVADAAALRPSARRRCCAGCACCDFAGELLDDSDDARAAPPREAGLDPSPSWPRGRRAGGRGGAAGRHGGRALARRPPSRAQDYKLGGPPERAPLHVPVLRAAAHAPSRPRTGRPPAASTSRASGRSRPTRRRSPTSRPSCTRRPDPESVERGARLGAAMPLATAEVAAVMRPRARRRARRARARARAFEPVGVDGYWSRVDASTGAILRGMR